MKILGTLIVKLISFDLVNCMPFFFSVTITTTTHKRDMKAA